MVAQAVPALLPLMHSLVDPVAETPHSTPRMAVEAVAVGAGSQVSLEGHQLVAQVLYTVVAVVAPVVLLSWLVVSVLRVLSW